MKTSLLFGIVLSLVVTPNWASADRDDWDGTYQAADGTCPVSLFTIRFPKVTIGDCQGESSVLLEERSNTLIVMIDDEATCSMHGWILQLLSKQDPGILVRGYQSLDAINRNKLDFECGYRLGYDQMRSATP